MDWQDKRSRPLITYPDLPVVQAKDQIIETLIQNPVIIIAGETGSGKTTQLPKICLEAGLGQRGLIGHTQPRRIAARACATRIASELQSEVGKIVGYQVRFSDKTHPDNYIKIMTDGILLAQTQKDPGLLQYDCLIIDEAHERSLNIDFLLGYLKKLLTKRKDLKVLITSATLEVEKFSHFFNNAPIIEVQGRSYPVEMHYLEEESTNETEDPTAPVLAAVDQALEQGPGDILIFQSTEKEIKETVIALKAKLPKALILSLYARQSFAEQQVVFQSASKRKIIVATNVAETSITVPNIRFVIDTGLARISRYNYRNKLQRLPIEPISQASADQRKGRCGRVGPGICYRLYTEQDFLKRKKFIEPEILRTNLAGVILKLLSLGVKEISAFPLVDPLDNRYVKDGFNLLERLQAVDTQKNITAIGRLLAQIPIEPKLGRILIAANQLGALKEILAIVSALSIIDPRERPAEAREKADESHARFQHPDSDFLSLLNLWHFIHEKNKSLSEKKFKKLCYTNFLSFIRICEWFDVYEQLETLMRELGFKINQVPADNSLIHKALLSGFLDTIGMKEEGKEYTGARHTKFLLHPASVLYARPPAWVVACEIVHTTKTYARYNAKVEPLWIEEMGTHLLKKEYVEPFWESSSGRVVAFEKTTLFGLPLATKRKVNYENLFPKEAREIFIREGLVAGGNLKFSFCEKNQAVLKNLEQLENRIRRQKILVDEQKITEFYDKHLPETVLSIPALKDYLLDKSDTLLCFKEEDIAAYDLSLLPWDQFPSSLNIKEKSFELIYLFDLSSNEDGITLRVPIEAMIFLQGEDFSWLVPGLWEEKIEFYLKSLPKNVRTYVMPLPLHIDKAKQFISPKMGSFAFSLKKYLETILPFEPPTDLWRQIPLPPFLKMHFQVEYKGKVIAKGDELAALYEDLKLQYPQLVIQKDPLERDQIIQWDFTLPTHYQKNQRNYLVTYYPALVDKQTSVSIQLFESKQQARYMHRLGLVRMYLLHLSEQINYLNKHIFKKDKKQLAQLPFGKVEVVIESILFASAQAIFLNNETVHDRQQFEQQLMTHRQQFIPFATQLIALIKEIGQLYQAVLNKLKPLASKKGYEAAYTDIQQQLANLFSNHFIEQTPYEWLKRFPIYLKAILLRLDKLPLQLSRDLQDMKEIEAVQKSYFTKLTTQETQWNVPQEPLLAFRWRIEELRISYFAQSLKTVEAVSKIRLLKLLATLCTQDR